jgi:hypothetical protein
VPTLNPLILCIDNTGVSISEPQVVLNKSLNSLSMVPEYATWLMISASFLSANLNVVCFRRSSLRAVGMVSESVLAAT